MEKYMINKDVDLVSRVNFWCNSEMTKAKIETKRKNKSKSEFSVRMFTPNVPDTLKTGRHIKIKSIILSIRDSWICVFRKVSALMYNAKHNKVINMLKTMIKYSIDRGFKNPTSGSSSFNSNPKNIKNATLIPTESETVPTKLKFSNLRNFKMITPGTKVR